MVPPLYAGNLTVKQVFFIVLSTIIVAPCSSKMPLEIDNPRPLPSPICFVVKNGLNSFCSISGVMPGPESITFNTTLSSSSSLFNFIFIYLNSTIVATLFYNNVQLLKNFIIIYKIL